MQDRSSFPAALSSAPRARHHAEVVLGQWGLTSALEVVRLLVSELVANAVTHARSPVVVALLLEGSELRVEVSDRSREVPVLRACGPSTPTGRGLMIVDDLADRWGVDVGGTGKTVWFQLVVSGERARPGEAEARVGTGARRDPPQASDAARDGGGPGAMPPGAPSSPVASAR